MDDTHTRLRALGLLGLAARLDEVRDEPWLARVLAIETEERQHRGLDRRMMNSRLGKFEPMTDFDGKWPTKSTGRRSRPCSSSAWWMRLPTWSS